MEDTHDRPPTSQETLNILRGVGSGRLTRTEAAGRARLRIGFHTPGGYAWSTPPDPLVNRVFAVLLACDISEVDFISHTAPYFFRESDLQVWQDALEHRDAPVSTRGHLQPKRPHQFRPAELVAVLHANVDWLCVRLSLDHFRGLDDLDYYKQLLFDDSNGRQVMLMSRPRGPSPSEVEVFLERGRLGWDAELSGLLALLGLERRTLAWSRGIG
jgi:hypothetical protein